MKKKSTSNENYGSTTLCLAKITQREPGFLIGKYGSCVNEEDYMIPHVLQGEGVVYIRYVESIMIKGRKYIITVPSLDVIGDNQCVIVDWSGDTYKIWDPWDHYTEDGYLIAYTNVIEILKG